MHDSENLAVAETNMAYESQLSAARAVNNTWKFEGRELERFVADGTAKISTSILSRKTKEKVGALIHHFNWEKDAAFINREAALVTKFLQLGRNKEQEVETAHLDSVNAEFYKKLVSGGTLVKFLDNGERQEIEKTRDEMIHHADLYPESASEAVETWFDAASFELIEDDDSLDFVFAAEDAVRLLWKLGDPDYPAAAAILTFKTPNAEARKGFEQVANRLKRRKQGEINVSEVTENFVKKIQYGGNHLLSVEGVAIENAGQDYRTELKQKFITLFNPIWFAKCVEAMHESFEFVEGKSGNS